MFLNKLNDDAKKAFLDLALICAKSDDVLDERESEILDIYCKEMCIERPNKMVKADYLVKLFYDDRVKFDTELDEILSKFDDIKIIYFEICAMIYADENVTEIEEYILQEIPEQEYGIANSDLAILKNSAIALLSQMNTLKDIEKLYENLKG